MIFGPSISSDRRSSIFVTAVIYPVVKVHRRGGSARSSWLPTLQRSAGRWAPGWSARIRRLPAGPRTRDDGSRTSLRTVEQVAWVGTRRSSRGWTRAIRFCYVRTCTRGLPPPGQGGGDEETRTPDPLLAKEMLFQLSYVPVLAGDSGVVGVSGLEPETSALSGQCSNQLS